MSCDCHVTMQLFHLSEEKIREVEHEYDDEGDFTKEVNDVSLAKI